MSHTSQDIDHRAASIFLEGSLPPLAEMSGRTAELTSGFRSFFGSRGYAEVSPLRITEHTDPSVLFVGATINVLKDRLLSDAFDPVLLLQPALRAQNLRRMFDPTHVPVWTSRFVQVGVLVPPDMAGELLRDSVLFTSDLFSDGPELVLRASTRDDDLIRAIRGIADGPETEIDGAPSAAYRHRYGISGVAGRNFNFALRQPDGTLYDIGNCVLVERAGRLIGAEFGFGIGTALKCLHSLRHAIQAYPVAELYAIHDVVDLKVADAVAVCSVLLAEGLRPGRSGQASVLKRYLRGIPRLLADSPERLESAVTAFRDLYRSECPGDGDTPERFGSYVRAYRDKAAQGCAEERIAAELSGIL